VLPCEITPSFTCNCFFFYCVICYRSGLIDHLGIEPLMMEALEKVEKDIKKPLLRSDTKNMAVLLAEFDKINKKYVKYSRSGPLSP
jgi:hypothetical protein